MRQVLLRERKRHTARRVASARYAALFRGGYPIPGWGGYPGQVLMVGVQCIIEYHTIQLKI